jgi:hypothetical protein
MLRLITALIIAVYVQVALPQEDSQLLGAWSGNGRASDAIYGIMNIAKDQISWGGTNPYNPFCKTTYTLVTKYTAATYPDILFPPVAGRTFTIYKLKLVSQPCTGDERLIQFAIASDNNHFAEVVTYQTDDHPTGWHSFSKLGNQ